jgi:hypothetical protein
VIVTVGVVVIVIMLVWVVVMVPWSDQTAEKYKPLDLAWLPSYPSPGRVLTYIFSDRP